MDFTLAKYEQLCQAIANSPYQCLTLADYLRLKEDRNNGRFILLRHDIDRTPRRAEELAGIEQRYSLRATYHFRMLKPVYQLAIMTRIAAYGHEIGYHYETLDKCSGELGRAVDLFRQELAELRRHFDIKTASAHGNPLTPYDNKNIWQKMKPVDLGLLGEAYLSLDFSQIAYFSDSGRTWLDSRSQKMPGKDAVGTAFNHLKPRRTDDIIRIINEGKLPNICILVHPERWTRGIFAYANRFLLDQVFSLGKRGIYTYRALSGGYRKRFSL